MKNYDQQNSHIESAIYINSLVRWVVTLCQPYIIGMPGCSYAGCIVTQKYHRDRLNYYREGVSKYGR